MKLAPIILFVYCRPDHTQKTIEALMKNTLAKQSDLFIFSDGPKDASVIERVKEVRDYIASIKGFRSINITLRETNFGLAKNIIQGVTEVLNKHENAIIIENDIVTTPNFLDYMNKALVFYKNNFKVFSITGFNFPFEIPENYKYDVYFSFRASSWGWATWKNRWQKADWDVKDYPNFIQNKKQQKLFNRGGNDLTNMLISYMKGKINSWAIRWCYTHFKNNAYCVYPIKPMVQNIGFDNSGQNCSHKGKKRYIMPLETQKNNFNFPKEIVINKMIAKNFRKFFNGSIKYRIKMFIKNLLKLS